MGNTYNSRKKFKKGIAFYKKSDIINYVSRLKIKICTVYAIGCIEYRIRIQFSNKYKFVR